MKTYRVSVIESLCYSTDIKANSAEEAEAAAQALWDAEGAEAFKLTHNDVDSIIADEKTNEKRG